MQVCQRQDRGPGLFGADHGPAHGRDAEQERRLGEGAEQHLAAGPHSLERRSGVQRGQHREQPRQPQQVDEQQEIAAERNEGGGPADRDQQQRRQYGGQPDHRPGPEDPSCRAAVDRAFVQ